MGRGGEIEKQNVHQQQAGGACCTLGLGLYMIIEGGANYNNANCDVPFLNDGVGVAKCMFYYGIAFVVSALLQITIACCVSPPEIQADGSVSKLPVCLSLPLCCVGLFAVGWNIFYAITTFQHKWDQDVGCPSEVHAFSWIFLILVYSVMIWFCVCCLLRLLPQCCIMMGGGLYHRVS